METNGSSGDGYSIGTHVQMVGDPTRQGVITAKGRPLAGMRYYQVFWGGSWGTSEVPEDCITPIDGSSSYENPGSWWEFQRIVTHTKLLREKPLQNHLYALNASRTKFFPYQYKPLLKFLDSHNSRLLIADEVGLGKTIEAGLILIELRARQTVEKVLVVCPANLRAKWRLELRTRFGEDFEIMDAKRVEQFLREYEESGRVRLQGIASYETLRNQGIQNLLRETSPELDLVIMDEAHHMRNAGTLTNRLGHLLSLLTEATGSMLMLTATPVQISSENLYSLLKIIDDERFPDLKTTEDQLSTNAHIVNAQRMVARMPPLLMEAAKELRCAQTSAWLRGHPLLPAILNELEHLRGNDTKNHSDLIELQRGLEDINLLSQFLSRTRKRDACLSVPERNAHSIMIKFSKAERLLYDAVSKHVKRQSRIDYEMPVVAKWVLNSIQRRMTSCMPAFVEDLSNAPSLSLGDLLGDQEDITLIDERASDSNFELDLTKILDSYNGAHFDSKFEALLEIIRNLQAESGQIKMIVFAFFKGTLSYLERRLRAEGIGVLRIDGDTPIDKRPEIIDRFRLDPIVEILLSSRVGSEGLDFQFCHILTNYDLPWNPMEVEQRIGRLDRIGQKSDVINIYNLWLEDTIETRILKRLYDRVEVFRHSIGELEDILGEIIMDLENAVYSGELTQEQQEQRMKDAERLIDRRKADLAILEKEATKLLGADDFYNEQVQSLKTHRKYITARQLEYYLDDFFENFCPKTRLARRAIDERVLTIAPDEQFRRLTQKCGLHNELVRFLTACEIEVTFDADLAFDAPQLEFVNVTHPLVRLATTALTRHPEKLTKFTCFELATSAIEVGDYFFSLHLVQLHSARSRNHLELTLLRRENLEPIPVDVREPLLGEMLEFGSSSKIRDLGLEPAILDSARGRALELLGIRIDAIRAEAERFNAALIARRTASVESSYDRKLKEARRILEEVTAAGKSQVIPMWNGKIAKLEADKESQLQKIDELRHVSCEYVEVVSGVMEVTGGSSS